VHHIQDATIRPEREQRRIICPHYVLHVCPDCVGTNGINVDAIAAAISVSCRIAANICEHHCLGTGRVFIRYCMSFLAVR
jgi:hypothetical protein